MIYLSGTTRQFFEHPDYFGCMFSIVQRTGKQFEALNAGTRWMLDNGAFTGQFSLRKWLSEMNSLSAWQQSCIGVIIPDVLGDWRATARNWFRYYWMAKRRGYPVAYATQDVQVLKLVPWNTLDVLFIGGTDEHKRGLEGERLALEAKRRGKWVHVGRVNSGEAAVKFFAWADSMDGTTFCYHPTQQIESIVNGLRLMRNGVAQQRRLL